MVNKYPYTDFNEYNLDWLIVRIKELTEQWAAYKTQMDADWLSLQGEWDDVKGEWTLTQNAFEDLKTYVMNYFENLNVQTEINTKLNQMAGDGTLSALIAPYIPTQVTAWLNEHVSPETGYVIDTSLTIAGAAADAKVVGDEFKEVQSTINDKVYKQILNVFIPDNVTLGKKTYFSAGNKITDERDQAYSALSEILPCKPGDVIKIRAGQATQSSSETGNYGIVFANADLDIISWTYQPDSNTSNPYTVTAPANAAYFRFNVNNNWESDLTKKYCTVNRDINASGIPGGAFYVYPAGPDIPGGVVASNKETTDATEVKIDPTTKKLYVNTLGVDNRRFFFPKNVYTDGNNMKIPVRNFAWARDMKSLYFRSPTASTTITQRVMPEYWNFVTSTVAEPNKRLSDPTDIHAFDYISDKELASGRSYNNIVIPSRLDNPETDKNLLIIGDSFVHDGVIPDRIAAKLTSYGLTNVKLVGNRQTLAGNKYCAYAAQGFYDFVTDPADLEDGHVNPFWNPSTNEIDFDYYAGVINVSNIDYVIIHLGINDFLDGKTVAQILEYAETLTDAIKSTFPNCVIAVDGLVIPSLSCPSHYNPIDRALTILNYNVDFENGIDLLANCHYAPVNTFFMAEYAYPYRTEAPCEGSTETVKVETDWLHPYTPGYYQIADESLLTLLYYATDL